MSRQQAENTNTHAKTLAAIINQMRFRLTHLKLRDRAAALLAEQKKSQAWRALTDEQKQDFWYALQRAAYLNQQAQAYASRYRTETEMNFEGATGSELTALRQLEAKGALSLSNGVVYGYEKDSHKIQCVNLLRGAQEAAQDLENFFSAEAVTEFEIDTLVQAYLNRKIRG